MTYPNIATIRYMGNKARLLPFIIPAIEEMTPPGGTVCDLCFGSGAVAYALKPRFRLLTNDVQQYSLVLSRALIVNQRASISRVGALRDLEPVYRARLEHPDYTFFSDCYTDTYFSARQCRDIDAVRSAVAALGPCGEGDLYLSALMGAMCKIQSSPGHFAQFMPAEHPRIQILRGMDLWREFTEKCDEYRDIVFSGYDNRAFCRDFHTLLAEDIPAEADTVYLDSPYTREQYSRFYHVLETIARGDTPEVRYKARYRSDRFQSGFCYPARVRAEFSAVMEYCAARGQALVISYSDRGVLPLPSLADLARQRFGRVAVRAEAYAHSTQGKGQTAVREYLLLCQ